jgi:hypothetical protein
MSLVREQLERPMSAHFPELPQPFPRRRKGRPDVDGAAACACSS